MFCPKSCRHKLVISTSFWSWLLKASSILTSLKYVALLFSFVNVLWVCWLFIRLLGFVFWSLWFRMMSFFVFVLDAIFCGTHFFIFQDTVWLDKSFDVFLVVPFISSSGLAIVAECVVGVLTVHETSGCWILVFMILKYVFFCVHPWCDFLWYNFFHFPGQCVAS